MDFIDIVNLSKVFTRKGEKIIAIKDLDLKIAKGEFVCIFGPNGCGKTTLLNILADLCSLDKGIVTITGKSLASNHVGFVFQNYSDFLLPWFKVCDNILLPLELRGVSRTEQLEKLNNLIKLLNINFSLDSFPYQLSGGQQQIVSLLRALIEDNEILLLDEPFSGLDYKLKEQVINFLTDYWQKRKNTIIFVTHDLEDAILTGNRIIVFKERPLNNNFLSCEVRLAYPRQKVLLNSSEFKRVHNSIIDFSTK
ncbi:MAG: ATP-binding cassette domain-containing protein [Patescibacteria group bacterium]|nr:ATP-binding cassette domain-containing protein [Patescibacteria group bacterium]